jgi:peptidoglycan/xylan/chitin deacetylase (PgdA/CDA1 family)
MKMKEFGILKKDALFFLPPYEWYNKKIAEWTNEEGLQLINYTPGTRSNADYTYPEMGAKYVSSDNVQKSILDYEIKNPKGLNGFILLVHIGTDPQRTDKYYLQLDNLITILKAKGYSFVKADKISQ